MSEVHIRIAKQGNRTVLPLDGEAGVSKAGGYTCVYQKCNGRLIWVNAIKRVKHFRHYEETPNCPTNTRDGRLHNASLGALAEWIEDAIKESPQKLWFDSSCVNCFERHTRGINYYGKPYRVDVERQYKTEMFQDFKYDVAVINKNTDEIVLWIEILSTNPVHESKASILNSESISWVEVTADDIAKQILEKRTFAKHFGKEKQSMYLKVINAGRTWDEEVAELCNIKAKKREEELKEQELTAKLEEKIRLAKLRVNTKGAMEKLRKLGYRQVANREFIFMRRYPNLVNGEIYLNLDNKVVSSIRTGSNHPYAKTKNIGIAFYFNQNNPYSMDELKSLAIRTRMTIAHRYIELEKEGFKPVIDFRSSGWNLPMSNKGIYGTISWIKKNPM